MKQLEETKREYIDKLKKELETIERRYMQIINENAMVGEDFRSRAFQNYDTSVELTKERDAQKTQIKEMQNNIDEMEVEMVIWERKLTNQEMVAEELLTRYDMLNTKREMLTQKI